MKIIFSTSLIVVAPSAFSQQEQLTKIYFKVNAECSCTVQFARNGKPAGKFFKMVSDSFLIAIDSATTGLYIHCGHSDTVYLPITYHPGEVFYRIYGKMGCEAKEEHTFSVEPMKV